MSTTKKGDILEEITELLEKSLSNDSTIITKKKKIKDLDGIIREIDIFIETVVNKRLFNIAIECKNYKENIKIEKIESFYTKCSRLPNINKMIYLTASNYQKGAIDKAKSLNVVLYKIIEENITEENKKDLGICNIYTIENHLKILKYRFSSKSLFDDNVPTNEKLNYYSKDGKNLNTNEFENLLKNCPDIWSFLNTKSGILFSRKKNIYPNLIPQNLFTKYNDKFYPIDLIQFALEIELKYFPLELKTLNKYHSQTEEQTFALFSNIEITKGQKKYKFHYIKPIDENNGRFFVTAEKQEPVELVTLGTLDDVPTMQLSSYGDFKNIQIMPYEFYITENAIKSIPIAERDEEGMPSSSKNANKISSTLFGIDTNTKKTFFMIPLPHEEKIVAGKIPEPISLYFNHSIELFKQSRSQKDIIISNAKTDELVLQDGSYHKYLQYFISSVFMLHSAIETFINSSINDDVEFEIGQRKAHKKDLEKLSLKEKLIDILPFISDFSPSENEETINTILALTELNEDLRNLKTSNSLNQPFLDTFEVLINFQMEECFKSAKELFLVLNKNYRLIEN